LSKSRWTPEDVVSQSLIARALFLGAAVDGSAFDDDISDFLAEGGRLEVVEMCASKAGGLYDARAAFAFYARIDRCGRDSFSDRGFEMDRIMLTKTSPSIFYSVSLEDLR